MQGLAGGGLGVSRAGTYSNCNFQFGPTADATQPSVGRACGRVPRALVGLKAALQEEAATRSMLALFVVVVTCVATASSTRIIIMRLSLAERLSKIHEQRCPHRTVAK